MWYIYLSIGICIVVAYVCLFKGYDWVEKILFAFMGILFSGLILFLLGCFIIPATSGLLPGYSTGERVGYLTKLSDKGIIWKTHEGQMQIGVGEMASLQEPFSFSVVKEDVWNQLQSLQGEKKIIRLKYKEWLMMPFRMGETSYEIIEVINKETYD